MTTTMSANADLHRLLTGRLVEHRADRARRILAGFDRLSPGIESTVPAGGLDAFDNAVLHHAFQMATVAARTRDADRARRAVGLWSARAELRERAISTAVGPVLVVRAADCFAVDDDRLGNKMFLLDRPAALDDRDRIAAVLRAAIDAALATGSDVLRSSTAIVITPETCELGQTCRSYTFDFLPSTAVLSWSEEPLRLAETLVHEATHSWLNECLEEQRVAFPEGQTFYSPWRAEDRPVFGIVHAALAFSHVVRFLSGVQPPADERTHLAAVLRQRLADEIRSLEVGYDAATRCFEMVDSAPLRTYLETAARQATAVSRTPAS